MVAPLSATTPQPLGSQPTSSGPSGATAPLSRLEQIRARARQRALEDFRAQGEEEKGRESHAQSEKTGNRERLNGSKHGSISNSTRSDPTDFLQSLHSRSGADASKSEESDDGDAWLPDSNLDATPRGASTGKRKAVEAASSSLSFALPSSSLKSSSPIRSPSKRHPDTRSALFDFPGRQSTSPSPPPSANPLLSQFQPMANDRPYRRTAHKGPYSYKLSLQRPSQTRQALLDAKHSAAVKMNIIKREDYKLSSHTTHHDMLDQMLQEQRKINKAGISSSALQQAIKLSEMSSLIMGSRPAEQRGASDLQGAVGYPCDEGAASPDTRSEDEQEDVHMEGCVGDSTENHGDHTDAELRFWRKETIYVRKASSLAIAFGGPAATATSHYQASQDDDALTAILTSNALLSFLHSQGGDQSASLEQKIHYLVRWLVEIAILEFSTKASFASVNVLDRIIQTYPKISVERIATSLYVVLGDIGARREKIASFGHAPISDLVSRCPEERSSKKLNRLERTNKVLRIYDILSAAAKSSHHSDSASAAEFKDLFLLAINLLSDPTHLSVRAEALGTIRALFDAATKASLKMDAEICRDIVSRLEVASPQARCVVLSCMPTHSMKARAVQRNAAYQLLTQHVTRDDTHKGADAVAEPKSAWPFAVDLFAIHELVSTEMKDVNPFWVPRDSDIDFEQLEANIQLLVYCLGDLALQIAEPSDKGARPVTSVQEDALRSYWASGAHLFLTPSASVAKCLSKDLADNGSDAGVPPLALSTSRARINQVKSIAKALQRLNARIVDRGGGGMGYEADGRDHSGGTGGGGAYTRRRPAGLARTRAKNALQRTSLLLLYGLSQLGFHSVDRLSATSGQMLLTSFMQKKERPRPEQGDSKGSVLRQGDGTL